MKRKLPQLKPVVRPVSALAIPQTRWPCGTGRCRSRPAWAKHQHHRLHFGQSLLPQRVRHEKAFLKTGIFHKILNINSPARRNWVAIWPDPTPRV